MAKSNRAQALQRGASARVILGIGVSALLLVAGAAISMTGVAAFFGFPLMAVGLFALVTTPFLARRNPDATPCPWCSAKVGTRKRSGPIICPECKKTIVVGPPEDKCCACPP
ncbi:MAG: hypothetical protein HY900_15875 [Deltaproteobacteria bacterium]|nr:hypothetical protein [Deltaproteobacteria bacterium]